MDPDEYQDYLEEKRQEEETLKKSLKMIESGNIEFVPEYNIDDEGEINVGGVLYKFPDFKECYYNGYTYYLPDLNGKSKRIKNKKVIITEFEKIEDGHILIKNFRVEKVS